MSESNRSFVESLLLQDVNATREELERLLEEEESRKLGDGKAMGRLLAESLPDLHWVCFAFIALLFAAGADLFNPWYVGEIIRNVIITKVILVL